MYDYASNILGGASASALRPLMQLPPLGLVLRPPDGGPHVHSPPKQQHGSRDTPTRLVAYTCGNRLTGARGSRVHTVTSLAPGQT